ncbi:MAG: lipopolysaccharide biosynthesis protein [Acidimicrobiales bacterium]|nr:lipopolysaccharide biosynthesis protein [Acidimicrobiales bacterium]
MKFIDRLPIGTKTLSSGLLINGVSAYIFISIASRDLGAEMYTPLGMLWALSFLLGPGIFHPLEQQTARSIASRFGEETTPVFKAASIVGGIATLLIVICALCFNSWLTEDIFSDQRSLLIAIILVVIGLGSAHLVKGVLAGTGRFKNYSRYLIGEGLGRLLVTAILVIFASGEVWMYGLALGLSPFIGISAALFRQKDLIKPGPKVKAKEISGSLGVLLIASLATAMVLNVSPLTVELLAEPNQKEEPGKFLNALLIARIPLFFFQAVQAALLPRLSQLMASKELEKFKHELMRLLGFVTVFGACFLFLIAVSGQWVTRIAFGSEYEISRQDMTLLAVSSVGLMYALSLTQGLLALHRQGYSAAAWVSGIATFPATIFLGDDLFLRVEVALIVTVFITTSLLVFFITKSYKSQKLEHV